MCVCGGGGGGRKSELFRSSLGERREPTTFSMTSVVTLHFIIFRRFESLHPHLYTSTQAHMHAQLTSLNESYSFCTTDVFVINNNNNIYL